jgi:hypothetical protein
MHHLCLLLGFGADAICPYMIFEAVQQMREQGVLEPLGMTDQQIYQAFVAATDKGISKIMAKMGISTLQSYKVGFLNLRFESLSNKCASRGLGCFFLPNRTKQFTTQSVIFLYYQTEC